MKKFSILIIILILIFSGPLLVIAQGKVRFGADYRTANRDSAQIAPKPDEYKEAVIQAYSARAFNWRGAFAVHTWIAVKEKDASSYIVYQTLGWRAYRGLPVVDIKQDIPDRNWFDQEPKIILDIRGEEAQKLIPEIQKAVQSYPYMNEYGLWPGPNSNSFIAHIARNVPQLGFSLPSNAVGKDFITPTTIFSKAPSGTGYQISIFGLLGVIIAKKEGLEINFLGLVYGIRFSPFKILFPGF